MTFSAIPAFGIDARQSRIVSDWALAQKYCTEPDKLLDAVLAFEGDAAAARYALRWPETRLNMGRADRNAYAQRCEALAKRSEDRAWREYLTIVRLVLGREPDIRRPVI